MALCVQHSGQIWVYMSLESGDIYPEMDDVAYMAAYDLEASTRLKSDIPITFAPRSERPLIPPAPHVHSSVLSETNPQRAVERDVMHMAT